MTPEEAVVLAERMKVAGDANNRIAHYEGQLQILEACVLTSVRCECEIVDFSDSTHKINRTVYLPEEIRAEAHEAIRVIIEKHLAQAREQYAKA